GCHETSFCCHCLPDLSPFSLCRAHPGRISDCRSGWARTWPEALPSGPSEERKLLNLPGLALAGRLPAGAVNTSKLVARSSCARPVNKPAKSSKRPLLGAAFYVWCYGCLLPVCRLIAPRLYRAMLVTRLGRIKCFVGFTSGPAASPTSVPGTLPVSPGPSRLSGSV